MATAGAVRLASALLGLLFIANSVLAGTKYRGQSEVKRGHAFNVTCMVAINEGVTWTKDGKTLSPELGPIREDERKVNESVEATLMVESAKMAHAGSYQCSALHAAERHSVRIVTDTKLVGVFEPGYDHVRFLDMGRTTFNLTCLVKEPTTVPFTVTWWKEDTTVGNSTLANRYNLVTTTNSSVLTVKPPQDTDFGNYSCRLGDLTETFQVYGKPYARLHPNHNVMEGQQIKIACTVVGQPWPKISWLYNNLTGSPNVTLEEGAEGGRYTFAPSEAGVEGAVLVLKDAERADYGQYVCRSESLVGNMSSEAATTLRVKDKYAALWPFIGICAEVVVLCAIILVYEKRRSKSADMDDSDTDNHEQKKS